MCCIGNGCLLALNRVFSVLSGVLESDPFMGKHTLTSYRHAGNYLDCAWEYWFLLLRISASIDEPENTQERSQGDC